VIHIIRNSDEPKAALIERFKLSEIQAEDILEIRLRQLARLEAIKIEQELAELRKEKQMLQDLLDNPSSMKRAIIKEIESDAKTYGDARRTLIEEAQKAVVEQKVVDEPVTVIISEKGWMRARSGIGHDATSSPSRPATACTAPSNAAPSTTCWPSAATAGVFGAGGGCRTRAATACRSPR
jgi:topoisomerase-4 subunit A